MFVKSELIRTLISLSVPVNPNKSFICLQAFKRGAKYDSKFKFINSLLELISSVTARSFFSILILLIPKYDVLNRICDVWGNESDDILSTNALDQYPVLRKK